MDMQSLTEFFMWCTIINGGIFILWIAMFLLARDLMYKTQEFWFNIPRETLEIMMYGFIGIFKFLFMFFNLIPFLVLLIMG